MSEFWAIAGMFVSSFTSATLLPGNSEVVLSGLLIAAQAPVFGLLVAAIVGNVLGARRMWSSVEPFLKLPRSEDWR